MAPKTTVLDLSRWSTATKSAQPSVLDLRDPEPDLHINVPDIHLKIPDSQLADLGSLAPPAVAWPPTALLYGLTIAQLDLAGARQLCADAIAGHHRLLVGVVNAAKIVNMRRDPLLRSSLLECGVVLADGQSVVWASRLLRRPLPERVTGIDLFESLLSLANDNGYGVYFLGATQQVMDDMLAEVGRRWPNVRIAGARNGYFTQDADAAVAAEIRASGAEMLFLGMSSPRKEKFLGQYATSVNVPVMHGVGGSFDILAGKTQRAPLAWQAAGLEWAYRLLQEPRRMFWRYFTTNNMFLAITLRELLRPSQQLRPTPATAPATSTDEQDR